MMTESKGPLLFSKQWVTPSRRDGFNDPIRGGPHRTVLVLVKFI